MSACQSLRSTRAGRVLAAAALVLWMTGLVGAQQAPPRGADQPEIVDELFSFNREEVLSELRTGVAQGAVRLPLAALLGAALALRPRRPSSPPRDPAVIETQIVLAIVGALIMIIIGASLARAFGIAGAANLIRYRAKIEDPKDAVVMLSTLALGLAAGVGLYGIATAATLFLVATLWIIEGFETRVRTFLLTAKLGERTSARRADVERLLRRAGALFELRTTADTELTYLVNAGVSMKMEKLSAALSLLAPDGKAQIEGKEEKNARPLAEADQE
jgi:uncharacterized membrane protein YhiD involved in acid resistance